MKIVPMILAAVVTAFIMTGLNSLALSYLDARVEPPVKHINGFKDLGNNKYCMDGLVIVSTKINTFYYRKPDNSLVTCKEYNEHLVTDI